MIELCDFLFNVFKAIIDTDLMTFISTMFFIGFVFTLINKL